MTCVIGMMKNGKIYMGADNIESSDSINISRDDDKVFIKDELLIGCTTSFRMINILQYQFDRPVHSPVKTVDEYIHTDWIESVRSLFDKSGFSSNNNNVEEGGNFIIGYRNNLYEIGRDFHVAKLKDNFCCIGCGWYFAYGAMKVLSDNDDISPEEMIIKALTVTEYYNPYVRGPFKILSM